MVKVIRFIRRGTTFTLIVHIAYIYHSFRDASRLLIKRYLLRFCGYFLMFSMNVLYLLSSEFACSILFRSVRRVNGVYRPRCGSISVKGYGNYMFSLKRYLCKACWKTFNDKMKQYSTTPGLENSLSSYSFSYAS